MLSAVSTVEDMRRGNLARFLELVHRERALSRSQLTTATGLNRSTVAALAAELVDLVGLNVGPAAQLSCDSFADGAL